MRSHNRASPVRRRSRLRPTRSRCPGRSRLRPTRSRRRRAQRLNSSPCRRSHCDLRRRRRRSGPAQQPFDRSGTLDEAEHEARRSADAGDSGATARGARRGWLFLAPFGTSWKLKTVLTSPKPRRMARARGQVVSRQTLLGPRLRDRGSDGGHRDGDDRSRLATPDQFDPSRKRALQVGRPALGRNI
jgi:hypothetical protein